VFSSVNFKHTQFGENWHRLKLISTFVHRFDFEHILEENINKYNPNQNQEVEITLIPQNITKVVQVNSAMQLWQLIIQVSKVFNMRIPEFRI